MDYQIQEEQENYEIAEQVRIDEEDRGLDNLPAKKVLEGKIMEDVKKQEWFQSLVEDCRATMVEAVFNSNWSLVEGYHELGKRILEEKANFTKEGIYGKQITYNVAVAAQRSIRTIERAVQFAEKYPDLAMLPDGKNVTWHMVVNKYLPAVKASSEAPQTAEPDKEIKIKASKLMDWVEKVFSFQIDVSEMREAIRTKNYSDADQTLDGFQKTISSLTESMRSSVEKIQ